MQGGGTSPVCRVCVLQGIVGVVPVCMFVGTCEKWTGEPLELQER